MNWIAKYPFQIILFATVMVSFAYGTTIFSSAIKSIPENQFKAARVDGASEWEIVKSIILPNIRYHIQFITLWETLGLLTNYVTIMLITDGGPGIKTEVWALSAYHKAFRGSAVRLRRGDLHAADRGGADPHALRQPGYESAGPQIGRKWYETDIEPT